MPKSYCIIFNKHNEMIGASVFNSYDDSIDVYPFMGNGYYMQTCTEEQYFEFQNTGKIRNTLKSNSYE